MVPCFEDGGQGLCLELELEAPSIITSIINAAVQGYQTMDVVISAYKIVS